MRSAQSIAIVAAVVMACLGAAGPAFGQGACCFFDQSCAAAADEAECSGLGGVFLPGEDCASAPCGQGACCFDVNCSTDDAYSCITAGREFAGAGTSCLDDPCESNIGACCNAGVCMDLSPDDCAAGGGTWLGAGTNCVNDQCGLGACCLPGACLDIAQFECTALGGVFTLGGACTAGPCDVVNECPTDSLYGQTRDGPDDFLAGTSEAGSGFQRWDSFTGVIGAIDGVRWWGVDLELDVGGFIECDETVDEFEITFYENLLNAPGPVVCSYTITATVTPTGISYLGTELKEYEVALPTPCVLVDGWISIVGQGDPDCWFLWMSSPDGDGTSLCSGCGSAEQFNDLAFCLLGSAGGVFGACCDLSTGMCADGTEIVDCIGVGLQFTPDTDCVDLVPACAPTTGACCFDDGTCTLELPADCVTLGGQWLGAGTDCTLCPPIGACCFDFDTCSLLTEADCVTAGFVWLGDGTVCADCPDPPVCPAGTLFGQAPEGPDGFESFTSEDSSPFRRFENFTGVAGPIDALTWWGLDLDNVEGTNDFLECTETDPTFEISFHEDAGGVPGALVCTYTVLATRTPTSILYLGTELNEYTATLPAPCVLVNGWVSIVGLGDAECWFLWMSSAEGDGMSYCSGCIATQESLDLAVCLEGQTGGVFGACCLEATGQCADGVEIDNCTSPGFRFVPDTLCADLVPPCGVILGACCFGDGTCSIETATDCGGLGGTWLGANTLCDQCPCVVPCPPGGVAEGEIACFDGYVDTYNGGCDVAAPAFIPISIGDTVCGTSGVFLDGAVSTGDFDWYEVTVPADTQLVWTAEAEFRPRLWIYDASFGCPATPLASNAAFECEELSISANVAAGTYWVVIHPNAFTDTSACPSAYRATLTQIIPCPADTNGDGTVDGVDLVNVILDWGTDGSANNGDVDGSGTVDGTDLVQVILAWGECG